MSRPPAPADPPPEPRWRQPFPVTSGLGAEARLLEPPPIAPAPGPGSPPTGPAEARPLLSIVVPFYNEADCVPSVLDELLALDLDAEVIAVDDGSGDATWDLIRRAAGRHPRLRGLRLTRNLGQSAAVYAGLRTARGRYCATMDGDGQNDPADFTAMLPHLAAADVVVGYRATRRDTLSRRLASRVANRIRRLFLTDGVRDTGCSMKIFPRQAVELLVPFNGLHRYLPAIFTRAGLTITEVPVHHRPRLEGSSKYTNWERALRGIHDLVGVGWLVRRKIAFPALETTAAAPDPAPQSASTAPEPCTRNS